MRMSDFPFSSVLLGLFFFFSLLTCQYNNFYFIFARSILFANISIFPSYLVFIFCLPYLFFLSRLNLPIVRVLICRFWFWFLTLTHTGPMQNSFRHIVHAYPRYFYITAANGLVAEAFRVCLLCVGVGVCIMCVRVVL